MDITALPPAAAAEMIRNQPGAVPVALAAALDDWATFRRNLRRDEDGAVRLSQVARLADPDPWRDKLRELLHSTRGPDRSARLKDLARSAPIGEFPARSLVLLGTGLLSAGDPDGAESVLREALRRYPADVWINFELALRQEAWERGKSLELGNLSSEPCGLTNPVRQSWPAAGSESCVVEGRPSLRSVDSECPGRAIEPRKIIAGVLALVSRGDRVGTPRWPGVTDPAGVGEQGQGTRGVPRNLGAPSFSTESSGSGTGTPTPRSPRPGVAGRREQTIDATVVSRSEGNEAQRKGGTGVGAPHSTVETGEPFRGTRWREGGAVLRDRWRETWRVHRNPWTCPRNNNGSHYSLDKVRRWGSRLWPT